MAAAQEPVVIYPLIIPRWHPATINQLLRSVRQRIRLKKADRQMVYGYALQSGIPRATGKRRVTFVFVLKPGQSASDVDSRHKSGLDALKHAGLIVDDRPRYCELAPDQNERGNASNWGTKILLQDMP